MKERTRNIISLRERGMSYQEIANIYNVSRQRIHQILKYQPHLNYIEKVVVYPNLKKWMKENNCNISELNHLMGFNKNHKAILGKKLKGKADLKLIEAHKLLEVTGLSFEECFCKEDIAGDQPKAMSNNKTA
jgi:DNA-directed RNA polymerase, sigma subunit (sigma70/sigma32)